MVSVVLEPDLLRKVDERAAQSDLNRSQYLRRLARLDIERAQAERQTIHLPDAQAVAS